MWESLKTQLLEVGTVQLFGRNHVFTNLIFGLGETDEEVNAAVDDICASGIIPTLRPFSSGCDLKDLPRPGFWWFMNLYKHHRAALAANGLDTCKTATMRIACIPAVSDMVPGRN